jgi:3-oxoacyl-[acyl-carrier-protein] synthase II
MTMRRVVITGIGAVTPLGNTFYDSWEAAKKGLSGIARVTRFETGYLQWRVAGEVKRFDADAYLSLKEQRRLDLFGIYAVAASVMAVQDAGLALHSDYLDSGGVIMGSSRGGISSLQSAVGRRMEGGRKRRLAPYLLPATTVGAASSYVAQKLGIKGYCLGISNACASGASAIGEAYRSIKGGAIGPVITGGAEAPLCPVCFEGYGVAGALSKTDGPSASRPFDRTRDGFVLAEGACVMVLEEMRSAVKRGASIIGEIRGYAGSCDAYHQTRPDAEGEKRAMLAAIGEAGLSCGDIDYISAHATSTPLGDRVEAAAVKAAFGRRAPGLPVSAVKSMTGHMLAASGALEAAFAAMSIKEGLIPSTINLEEQDLQCGLNVVTQAAKAEIRVAISASYGFGGVNAVLVLGRPPVDVHTPK